MNFQQQTVLELLGEFGFDAQYKEGSDHITGWRVDPDQEIRASVHVGEPVQYHLAGRGWSASVPTLGQFRRLLEIQAPKRLLQIAEVANA